MNRKLVFIGCTLCLLALFAGCADRDLPLSVVDKPASPASTIFQLSIVLDDNNRPTTRVGEEGGGDDLSPQVAENDSTPGHDLERALHSIHLFVVPVTSTGGIADVEQWDEMKYGAVTIAGEIQNPIKVEVEEVPATRIRVYIGANLSEAQVEAFRNHTTTADPTQREYVTEPGRLYSDVINEFAPFGKDAHRGIAMFSNDVLTVNTATDNASTGNGAINLGTVGLKRMVAKVLVTCATTKGENAGDATNGIAPGGVEGVEYVKLTNEFITNAGDKPKGWIRQQDVYYFINNMPRRARFFQTYRDDDKDGIKETLVPNYNFLESMKNLDTNIDTSTPLEFNEGRIQNVFIHYDQLELYRHNDLFQPTSVWNQKEYDKLVDERYAQSAYNQEGVGMYSLENVFDAEDIPFLLNEQLMNYAAIPMLTQVSIAACFTPRFIYVTKEEWETIKEETLNGSTLATYVTERNTITDPDKGTFYYLECSNEAAAQAILTASLQIHGKLTENDGNDEYDPGKTGTDAHYPINTYFAYAGTSEASFNSYGAASQGNKIGGQDNAAVWPEMVPFTRGWGYYYTYINNVGEGPITDISQSCIERNRYYILTINSIGHMGASVTDPRYIKVYTRKADWKEGGEGSITLN